MEMNNNNIEMNNNISNNNNINMNMNMDKTNINNSNFNLPLRPINNYNINIEASYINSVLQAIVHLESINYWIKIIESTNVMNNIDNFLTKEFYQLFRVYLSGKKNVDSTGLITQFQNKSKMIYEKELDNDPYHFLFYFLEILHLENNAPLNPNYDIKKYINPPIENMRNDKLMFQLYAEYFQQTQNSIISDSFFNTEKYLSKCKNCPEIYFYGIKKIFLFNIDKYRKYRDKKYPNKTEEKLTLDDCFICYEGGNKSKCNNCRHSNCYDYRSIFTSTKVLILAFKREKHNSKGDIYFKTKISISKYVIQNTVSNMNYVLKSIIYMYNENNKAQYFVDVLINNSWIRFLNNDIKKLKSTDELYRFEPQILIYELENEQKNYINPIYNTANKMNNNNIIPIREQQIINQMNLFQTKNIFQIIKNNLVLSQFNLKNININIMKSNLDMNPFSSLKFLIIPKNWDNSEENPIKILVHINLDDTMEKAINNFFIKLQKPRESIIKFIYNNNEINQNSQETLINYGINEDSIIYALKADNFESLKFS